MITALLLNDIHASRDNLDEFTKNWGEAMDVCEKNNAKLMIVGGDLFQSRASQTLDTLLTVRNCLNDAASRGLKVILMAGNHDKTDQESYWSFNKLMENDKIKCLVPDITKNYIQLEKGHVLWMLDYYPENGTAVEKIRQITKELNPLDYNVLYCHQGISGALSKPSSDEIPASEFAKFDKVLVGHYHNRCQIPNTRIFYIGSSRQHNYGEDEDKGYVIIRGKLNDMEYIKNQVNIRYATVECDLKDVEKETVANRHYLENSQYRVRLRIHVKPDDTVDKDAYLAMGYNKVETVDESLQVTATTEESLETKFDKTGIREEYLKFCQDEDTDPALGLSYLEKIN